MRWTARSGSDAVTRTLTIRLIGSRNVITQPVKVLLAGPAADNLSGTFFKQQRVVRAATIEPTFDAAASRRSDVRVIVVDVDEFGVAMIRDLHTVFPAVKIVALASSPRQLTAALKAGAAVALPRSTPLAVLTRVVQRLLSKPAKPGAAGGTGGAKSRALAARLP
jgi:DNA-binding NarL/FixJ family response regulator